MTNWSAMCDCANIVATSIDNARCLLSFELRHNRVFVYYQLAKNFWNYNPSIYLATGRRTKADNQLRNNVTVCKQAVAGHRGIISIWPAC